MLSIFRRGALALLGSLAASTAQAQSYPTGLFTKVRINGCSSGYVKHDAATCVTAIPAADLAAGAAVANIGYTPANKAGDTFTGNVGIGGAPSAQLDVIRNNNTNVDSIRIYNQATGATASARNSWATGTANSYVIAALKDNSGSPYFIFSGGAAITGFYFDAAIHYFRTQAGAELARFGTNGLVLPASAYANFGGTGGSGGYGIFDNAGTLQIKNSGGSWNNLPVAAAVAADVRTGTDATKFVTSSALAGSASPQTLTDQATVTWDAASGYNAKVTLGGNRTMAAMTNAVVGQTYTLQVIQDATGSRTLTWNAAYTWGTAGAPTLTTTASKMDLVSCICTAATPTFACSIAKGF